MKNLITVDNALVKRDITILRNVATNAEQFRMAMNRIAYCIAIKTSEEFSIGEIEVQTPLEKTKGFNISKPIILVPVLRAGLSLVNAFVHMIPNAKVGHIGLQRDEATLKPVDYYYKVPPGLDKSLTIVLDPMLATGGSASTALTFLKNKGAVNLTLACLIAAPQGVAKINEDHKDVNIYTAVVDRELNSSGYILPGLGDAGDRIYDTL